VSEERRAKSGSESDFVQSMARIQTLHSSYSTPEVARPVANDSDLADVHRAPHPDLLVGRNALNLSRSLGCVSCEKLDRFAGGPYPTVLVRVHLFAGCEFAGRDFSGVEMSGMNSGLLCRLNGGGGPLSRLVSGLRAPRLC